MPKISVGPDQVEISYIDSGEPSQKGIYTTLLIVHGFCWNGVNVDAGVFRKVIERAPSHGIRAIAINRRGYKDSSLFMNEELAPLEATTRTPQDTRTFMKEQAVQLAEFLKQLTHNGAICAPIGGCGGVTLLGWSLGNTFVCDFLSHVSSLPEELSQLVKKFVRAFIMFDPSFEAISLPPPAPAHLFWVQHVMQRHTNPQDAFTAMADFVSGWFEYPPLPANRSKDVSSWSDADRIRRYVSTIDRPMQPSTRVAEIGDPTFKACNEPSAASSDITIMTPVYTGEFRHVTDGALFKDPESTFWTGMRIEYVYCVNSFWPCVYAGEAVRCRFEGAVPGRRVKAIPEANHFLPWTEPDRFLAEIVTLL